MKFYDREQGLKVMEQTRQFAFAEHSMLTVMTGRRRIGKTSLLLKSCEDSPTVYLFVSRSIEADLCNKFIAVIEKALNITVHGTYTHFDRLFEYLMSLGKTHKFNLIIDEFQEFFYINPSLFSSIQNIWDSYRKETRINLITSGSVYTLMHRIFQDYKEPLYGRADRFLKLTHFGTATLKEIISSRNATYSNDDLLALFTITGGVPKYIELFVDAECLTLQSMVDFMLQNDSIFINEGHTLLIQELGKQYGSYFSILSAIASGRNTVAEMSQLFDKTGLGGLLSRLEVDYEVIKKVRPILAKDNSQTVRYEISDNFLRFWFRYFWRNQQLVETGNFKELANIIISDYPTYSGLALEHYFKLQFAESMKYKDIGSYWETKGSANQIDIVALSVKPMNATAVEIKRQRKNYNADAFALKVEHLREKLLRGYSIEPICLTLDDM
jgi:AAA+ ATPase superfamily predicted ATPase